MLDFIVSIHAKLGFMDWPLTIVSLLMIMIVLERIVFVLLNCKSNRNLKDDLYQLSFEDDRKLEALMQSRFNDRSILSQGLSLLISHRHFEKSLREDSVSLWLQETRRNFLSGLKLLQILGVLSPLLGLLGTVIGLIEMFKDVALTQGSVTPAHLADGLGLAMASTAAGLFIAVPAIACSQLFNLWANRKLDRVEYLLNHCNLHLSQQDNVKAKTTQTSAKTNSEQA